MENLPVLKVTLPIKMGLIYDSIWKHLGMAFRAEQHEAGGALALAESWRERAVPKPISRTSPGRWTVIAVPVCFLYGIFH